MKKITIVLKAEQKRDLDTYEFTYLGEKKIIRGSSVSFYVIDEQNPLSRLCIDEIEEVTTPGIVPSIEYLTDSKQFRVHKLRKIAISNMDIITDRKIDGDFVLLSICFGWQGSPLYQIMQEELKSATVLNTEK